MSRSNLQEVSVASNLYEPSVAVLDVEEAQPIVNIHTYRPTRWPLVNQILDIVDSITHGRAGQFQRLFSFVFIGGVASLVNLGVFAIVMGLKMPPAIGDTAHYAIAFLCASEISILANFIPNDYFTFRFLPGHKRSWSARCLRYHMTAASGTLLTYLISFALSQGAHVHYLLAQAISILIVLFYNFTAHHFFTYRRLNTAAN